MCYLTGLQMAPRSSPSLAPRRPRRTALPPGGPRRPRGDPAAAAGLDPVLLFLRSLWEVDHGLARTSRAMQARLGVTGPQRLVLRIVWQSPGISAGDLARVMHLHPSSLTGVLRRLVQRGLLRRRAHPGDSRRAVLTITPRGRATARPAAASAEERVRRALSALPRARVEAAQEVLAALAASLGHREPVRTRRPARPTRATARAKR
jgi:DNA-binding MarR family transcriptional regulator